MEFVKWDRKLALGIDEIDQQHRVFIEILQKLYEVCLTPDSKSIFSAALQELLEYSDYHFMAEETFMRKHDYPELSSHQLEHRKFTQKIETLQESKSFGGKTFSMEVITFLRDWFIEHIQGTDQQFAAFLRERKLVNTSVS